MTRSIFLTVQLSIQDIHHLRIFQLVHNVVPIRRSRVFRIDGCVQADQAPLHAQLARHEPGDRADARLRQRVALRDQDRRFGHVPFGPASTEVGGDATRDDGRIARVAAVPFDEEGVEGGERGLDREDGPQDRRGWHHHHRRPAVRCNLQCTMQRQRRI